jgi:broad specificity phosphatase PhoE
MRNPWIGGSSWVWPLAALAVAACAALPAFAATAPEPAAADLRPILQDLRKGGYVIFMRHASTEEVGATDEAADLARCETQRQLSASGRAQAVAIGKAVKALGIPIGDVQTSPFCRAIDTADLAFGRHTVAKDLVFVMNTDAAEAKRLGGALRRMLSAPPRRGTNTVLVSHSANLREGAGIFAKPEGAAYVFRPLRHDAFEMVARILPEDWTALAQRERAGKRP